MECQFIEFQNTDIREGYFTTFQITWHDLQSKIGRSSFPHYSEKRPLLVSYILNVDFSL